MLNFVLRQIQASTKLLKFKVHIFISGKVGISHADVLEIASFISGFGIMCLS